MNRFEIYNTILARSDLCLHHVSFILFTEIRICKNIDRYIYVGFGNKGKTEIHPPLTMNRSNRSNDRCMLRSGKRKTEIHAAPIINRYQSESGKQDHRSLYSPRVEWCLIAILRVNSRRFFYV